jgi:dolichol kinase
MMEQLFKWFRDIMYFFIPGLIYFADMIIILQYKFDLDFSSIIKKYEAHSLYLIIVVILISYTLGQIMDIGIRGIVWFYYRARFWSSRKKKEDTNLGKFKRRIISSKEPDNESKKKYQETFSNYYKSLILTRSLFASILLLLIILLFPKTVNVMFIICIISLLICLLLGYFRFRDFVIIIEKTVQIMK